MIINKLRKENRNLKKLLKEREARILCLEKEVLELKQILSELLYKKNSRNSSIPPSKDENRPKPNRSLREVSGKKPGGQIGRKGKTLEMTQTPDEIIKLKPSYCQSCGASLQEVNGQQVSRRQLIDIPPIKPIYTEYQTYSKECNCGHCTVSEFPRNVNAPVSYGVGIESLIAYCHARQYLPFARMKELFTDVFNINISEGGLHHLLKKFANKTTPIYEYIRRGVQASQVVGTDETGANVNGDRNWFWTWQTPIYTYICHSDNRGTITIKAHFNAGFPESIIIHDGWKAQVNTPAKAHQLCIAHLLRDLIYLNELYSKSTWGKTMLSILKDALTLENKMCVDDYTPTNLNVLKIMERFEALLEKPPDQTDKKLYTFYKRMLRDKEHIFTFLQYADVPPDNNGSERAIRNVKVKQKISGQFKIADAAQNFAKIRSVIDTTIKNGQNVLNALKLIANFEFQF